VHPSLPVRSIPELVRLAKGRPGEIAYASNGVGTTAHIAAELFAHAAQVRFNHVPYKEGGVAITDLLGGHVQMLFGAVSTSIPHMKAGRLRALGVTTQKRLTALPDVPAIGERLPGYEVTQWFGLFAPAGTPAPVVSALSSEVRRIVATPQVQQRFVQQGIEPVTSTPEQFAAYVKSELEKWTKTLKQIGIQSGNAPS
jgi:tripartite-type tricarboxylate transporter receptor subunit TctC